MDPTGTTSRFSRNDDRRPLRPERQRAASSPSILSRLNDALSNPVRANDGLTPEARHMIEVNKVRSAQKKHQKQVEKEVRKEHETSRREEERKWKEADKASRTKMKEEEKYDKKLRKLEGEVEEPQSPREGRDPKCTEAERARRAESPEGRAGYFPEAEDDLLDQYFDDLPPGLKQDVDISRNGKENWHAWMLRQQTRERKNVDRGTQTEGLLDAIQDLQVDTESGYDADISEDNTSSGSNANATKLAGRAEALRRVGLLPSEKSGGGEDQSTEKRKDSGEGQNVGRWEDEKEEESEEERVPRSLLDSRT